MSNATLMRNETRVQVRKEHFGTGDGMHGAVVAAAREAVGDLSADIWLRVLDYIEEQDLIVVVDQPNVTWWAYLPWPAAGPVLAEMWGESQDEALNAAKLGLLAFELQWHEDEPPEVGDDA
jgi:hypothetical protein